MRNNNNKNLANWNEIAKDLYGKEGLNKIEVLVNKISETKPKKIENRFSNKDIFVISYANSIKTQIPNLSNVPKVINEYYPLINNIHFLPFFSWTSDDGFSVSNYYEIDKRYGKWSDLLLIDKKYTFMFDFVINHTSKENIWFKHFLENKKDFKDFYIEKDPKFNYQKIIRPRTSSLFHKFGKKWVWTTFSKDQVDLNFRSVNVVLEIIKLLHFYFQKGMTTVRLDAVGFIWKESGHNGMHHLNTHKIIKMIKSISYDLFGELKIISEVNVPHKENIKYLGENGNESDEVYNFALPPLMAYTLLSENAKKFKKWMIFFENLKNNESVFNFLASHDGIGQRAIESILNKREKEILVSKAKIVGGKFNLKLLPNNKTEIYEINSTYTDMLWDDKNGYNKMLFAHSIILFLRGTPAIYFNSLFVKRNYFEGVKETGENRSINREKFLLDSFDENLTPNDKLFIKKLNEAMLYRIKNNDFDPYKNQKTIEDLPKEIIGFTRNNKTIILGNTSSKQMNFIFEGKNIFINPFEILIIKNNKVKKIGWK